MSAGFPSTYDQLAISGILPYDVNQILFDKPSEYLKEYNAKIAPGSPHKDEFKSEHGKGHKEGKEKESLEPKQMALLAIGTYIAGSIMSRSTNPIKGMKAIGKFALNLIKLPIKVLKK